MPIFGIGLPGEGYAAEAGRKMSGYQDMQGQLIKQALNQQNDAYGLSAQARDRIMASAQSGMSRASENPNINMANIGSILKQRAAAQGSEAFNNTYDEQRKRQLMLQMQAAGMYGDMANTQFAQQQAYQQQANAAGSQIGSLMGIAAQYGPGWFGKGGAR